jgi:hypothetical protein
VLLVSAAPSAAGAGGPARAKQQQQATEWLGLGSTDVCCTACHRQRLQSVSRLLTAHWVVVMVWLHSDNALWCRTPITAVAGRLLRLVHEWVMYLSPFLVSRRQLFNAPQCILLVRFFLCYLVYVAATWPWRVCLLRACQKAVFFECRAQCSFFRILCQSGGM